MDKTKHEERKLHAEENYPGAAFAKPDDDNVCNKEVRQRTRVLDNNPRNDDGPNPQKAR